MKATIQFLKAINKSDSFNKFLLIIPRVEQFWQHLLKHGVLLENLEVNEIEAIKQFLNKLSYTNFIITGSTVKIGIENDKSLLRLIGAIPNSPNYFEEIVWKRGLTIEKLTQKQADQLDSQLKTEKIGSAITSPDNPQPLIYKIAGKVLWSDNTPLADKGYVVHVFDKNLKGDLSLLGKAPVEPNSICQMTYPWESDGRNGPELIIQLFNPQNAVVAEQRIAIAKQEEKISLIVKKTDLKTYTLTGVVKNQATGAVLSNLQVEAQFRANNVTLLSRSGITNEHGVVNLSFDESLFNKIPANQQVEVIFIVSQDGQSLNTTTSIKSLFPRDQTVDILVTVSEVPGEKFIVKGTIRKVDGSPLQNKIVRAYDRDLRKEQKLGEQFTNMQGVFEIIYTRELFSQTEKTQADIYLKVYASDNKDERSNRPSVAMRLKETRCGET